MTNAGLWTEPLYRETVALVIVFLIGLSVALFLLRTRSAKFMAAWASLKSWLLAAPLLLFIFGLPHPWPLVFATISAIYGSKTFFRMVGMYHRSWFVWTTYLFIIAIGLLINYERDPIWYNASPMIFLGVVSFIPLLRNSFAHMIQYLALSLMAFIFLGWGFMHMGRLLILDQGIYIVLYIYILTEFAEHIAQAGNKFVGRTRPFSKISARFTIEGFIVSVAMTLLLAWGMRHMLPDRSEPYWIAAGLICSLFGRTGDLIISVIRRDLGIKETGIFIIGRDDILARMDKFIFVAPLFYYTYLFLERYSY